MSPVTVLIWNNARTVHAARTLAERVLALGLGRVIIAGERDVGLVHENVVALSGLPGRAAALEHALLHARGEVLVIQEPDAAFAVEDLAALAQAVLDDEADVVIGRRPTVPRQDAAVARLARLSVQHRVADLLCGQKALRVSALRGLVLNSTRDEVEAELMVKLSMQQYRFKEVGVTASTGPRPLAQLAAFARVFARAASTEAASDTQEGYATLANLEAGAPNYNAWLGERFSAHAGRRVLEIGAGIGTITSHLARGREKVMALDVDPLYIRRLQNRFRGTPQVEPHLSDVALADWQALRAQDFDTVVLSNVLEHIEDDGEALRRFSRLLPAGGKLLMFVPALPALFGSLDEAVGHYRRYSPAKLREALEANGFDVESVEWMNLIGIPGWFLNGKLMKRRVMPPLQLRLYDTVAPMLARAESKVKLPIGLSLFCVARSRGPVEV